jgi:hypothetical protein
MMGRSTARAPAAIVLAASRASSRLRPLLSTIIAAREAASAAACSCPRARKAWPMEMDMKLSEMRPSPTNATTSMTAPRSLSRP